MNKRFHIEERIWRGTKRRWRMKKKPSKNTLANYLISWKEWIKSLIKHHPRITKGGEWRDDDEQAFQQLLQLIEASEPGGAWIDKWADDLWADDVLAKGDARAFIERLSKDLPIMKPKVNKKWMSDFTHDVFVFDPSEEYTLYDFLKDKLEEAGLEVEETKSPMRGPVKKMR